MYTSTHQIKMPVSRLDSEELRSVLADLGGRLTRPVEIVIVGGAAGILTGELQRRLTSDCDVPVHIPQEAWGELRRHALAIARERGLSEDWLNAETRMLLIRMPLDWRCRARHVGEFGHLKVTAIGRLDLIAMKFIAGRAEDREDLRSLGVSTEEASFVRQYLSGLAQRHPKEAEHVEDALELLDHGDLVGDEFA